MRRLYAGPATTTKLTGRIMWDLSFSRTEMVLPTLKIYFLVIS